MTLALTSAGAPDISPTHFWKLTAAERAPIWAELRANHPVSLQPGPRESLIPARPFWAVTRHADVQHVSRNADVFCSGQGVGMADIPVEFLELTSSFLVMDAPRHTKMRRIVSGAFTPRRVAMLDELITAEAHRNVDRFVSVGGGDVVEGLSKHLPLWAISTMMGVPESMRAEMYDAAEGLITIQDSEFVTSPDEALALGMECSGELHRIAAELMAMRLESPTDDILSVLAHADVDGERLTEQDLGAIFMLFAVAGNDTTRNSTSHGIRLFAENPDQWRRLRAEPALLPSAVEEVVRVASPVIHFRRTTTVDTELAGVPIPAGEPVVMFYESANQDEEVFEDAQRFDIGRSPNQHVAFGGGGPHFCLGANLARTELRATFGRLSELVSGFEVGQADYLTSSFVHGIKRMSVTVIPA